MNRLIRLKQITPLLLFAPLLACFGVAQIAQAVTPAPDGGYPGGNTAEGQAALLSLTTGGFNTAVGFLALRSDTMGGFNTAIGAGALLANVGNSSSNEGFENTAIGAGALLSNSTGNFNTATGAGALVTNTTGSFNEANGFNALGANTSGIDNTANGNQALSGNTVGIANTANGFNALANNTTGSGNVALGVFAGLQQTTGSNNVYIGNMMEGTAGESNACYIGSIFGQTNNLGTTVFIDGNGKLGTLTSSKRFKEDIQQMGIASEALFALRPITFRYKKEIDPAGKSQFGLVAEDVEKINPDLVVRDKEGKPYSVRYDQVNAMLLNEFLKEHKAFVEGQGKVEQLEKQVEALTTGLQKVSAQLEMSKAAPQTVLNDQ